MSDFVSLKKVLQNRDPKKGRYARYEWQAFGYELMRKLDDEKHRGIYMKLAKNEDRRLLEEALDAALEGSPRSRAKVFMWKLAKLRNEKKEKSRANQEGKIRSG